MRTDASPPETSSRETVLNDQLRHALIEIRRLRTILHSRDQAAARQPATPAWSGSYWFLLGVMAGGTATLVLLA
jgi:hypothetical protein